MDTQTVKFVIRRRDGEGKVMPDDRLDSRSVKDLLTSIEFELQLLNARFADAFLDLSHDRAGSQIPPPPGNLYPEYPEVKRGK